MKFRDLSGKQFGELTVLGLSEMDRSNRSRWSVQCSCGVEKTVQVRGALMKVERVTLTYQNGNTRTFPHAEVEFESRPAAQKSSEVDGEFITIRSSSVGPFSEYRYNLRSVEIIL